MRKKRISEASGREKRKRSVTMALFYFDEYVKEREAIGDYTPVIERLESIYTATAKAETVTSLVGYSWYYLIEGDVNTATVNYDYELHLKKFKQYIDIGLEKFSDDEGFCFTAGYCLDLHGFYLGEEYERKGKELMKKCLQSSRDGALGCLAEIFLSDGKKKKHDEQRINAAVAELFPSGSLLDKYFRQIFSARK